MSEYESIVKEQATGIIIAYSAQVTMLINVQDSWMLLLLIFIH